MPPKNLFTKKTIIAAALDIVRAEGMAALTARSLAQRLGTSTKPIFGLFENMQQVQAGVISAAFDIYQTYLLPENTPYPPYKASGMGYIRFAGEEKELFRLLFMRDRSGEVIAENRETVRPQLEQLQQGLGLSEEEAWLFHIEMWVTVHGIATMLATNYLAWDMEFVSNMLTDLYQGLCHRFRKER